MPNNTNPQAILFANNEARPMADLIESMYQTGKNFINHWTVHGISTVIPNDSSLIEDGATVSSGTADGRTPITNADVNILFAHVSNLVAYLEGASGAPANNGSMQNRNQVAKLAVNGKPKF